MRPVTASASMGRSTRWCPTAEQVMLLEEMYKGGLRNPSASQIHQITTHLLRFGKVQGKNVFYWFQNHKARDKQRLKTKPTRLQQQQSCHYGKLAEQCSPSCISFTGPLVMVTHQPGTVTAKATSSKVKPYEFGGMRDNALIWSGMYHSHDYRNTLTSMNGQEGQDTYFRSLTVSQSSPRLQTLNLFPVNATLSRTKKG